jgi:hypothetical protein
MDFKFTPEIVASILRKSEGALAPAQVNGRNTFGHTGERHSAITNADLNKRRDETPHGGVELFLAFQDFKQAVAVGTTLLNHSQVTPLIENFYYRGKEGNGRIMGDEDRDHNGQVVRVIEDGGRLNIESFDIGENNEVAVRLAGKKGTLKTSLFTMRLQKKVGFPVNLMIVTFFPTLRL